MSSCIIPFPRPDLAHSFTIRDLIALQGFGSAQCRVAIEAGVPGGAPDEASFALIYAGPAAWASWGVARDGEHLTVWDCVSLADLGRFRSMPAALASLPLAGRAAVLPPAAILPFRPRLAG